MIPFKLGKHKFNLATTWKDVTLGQFLQLRTEWDKEDPIQLFAILSGLPKEVWENTDMPDADNKIMAHLDWMAEMCDFTKLDMPKKITVNGKTMTVPLDIRIKTLGQKIYLQRAIVEAMTAKKDLCLAMPYALATYMCEEYTGKKWSDDEVKKIIPDFESGSVIELYPVAGFFLNKSLSLIGLNKKS